MDPLNEREKKEEQVYYGAMPDNLTEGFSLRKNIPLENVLLPPADADRLHAWATTQRGFDLRSGTFTVRDADLNQLSIGVMNDNTLGLTIEDKDGTFIGLDAKWLKDSSITTDKIGTLSYADPVITNPYKFSVYRSAAQNLAAGPGVTKVSYDTEDFDSNNNFSGGTYTVPVDGFYHFDAQLALSTSTADTFFIILYKNGSEVKRGNRMVPQAVANPHYFMLSCLLLLTEGDTIEVYGYNGRAATTALEVGSMNNYFMGYLMCHI